MSGVGRLPSFSQIRVYPLCVCTRGGYNARMLPVSIRTALWRAAKWFGGFILFSIPWEIFKDRAANWANTKIDSESGRVMEFLASHIHEIAVAPLGYTLAGAILVFVLAFVHAYWKENKNKVAAPAEPDATEDKLSDNEQTPFAAWRAYIDQAIEEARAMLRQPRLGKQDIICWRDRTANILRISIGETEGENYAHSYDLRTLGMYKTTSDTPQRALREFLSSLEWVRNHTTSNNLIETFDPRDLRFYTHNQQPEQTFESDFERFSAIKDEETRILSYQSDGRVNPVERDEAIEKSKKRIEEIKHELDD